MTNKDIAIQVKGLSKVFYLYSKPIELLKEFVLRKKNHRERWALKDVSFEVKKGEVVGLIGRNGSGKSTLLRILSGILDKTSGEVFINGNVSSILELGTGFHPEYTGRENILMGGMCLGMSREEIESQINRVIEFSELKDFIDQPLKTYSTGMKARLAFSTAICMDPDILFIDEALSVGDVKFNRKCFDVITQLRAKGKTILLVSHDLNTVCNFCDKALLLEEGQLVTSGEPRDVTRIYYELLFCQTEKKGNQDRISFVNSNDEMREKLHREARQLLGLRKESAQAHYEMRCGNSEEAEVLNFGILDQEGNSVTLLNSGEKYTFFLQALFYEDVEDPAFGFLVRNPKGVDLFGIGTGGLNYIIRPHKKGEILEGRLEVTMWLTNGEYFLSTGIGNRRLKSFDFHYDGLLFSITRHPLQHTTSMVNLQPMVSHRTLPTDAAAEETSEKIA